MANIHPVQLLNDRCFSRDYHQVLFILIRVFNATVIIIFMIIAFIVGIGKQAAMEIFLQDAIKQSQMFILSAIFINRRQNNLS